MTRTIAVTLCAAVMLAGCANMSGEDLDRDSALAGNYLSGNFAAATGNIEVAQKFYGEMLKNDPSNEDVLERAFLFAATAGDVDRANDLSDDVLRAQSDNRAARLVRAVVALKKRNYADVRKEDAQSASGPFTALTITLLNAWSYAGNRDYDSALKTLEYLKTQNGMEGLYNFHKAALLDYAGRDKEAGAAYQEAIRIMGRGQRVGDAYARFLQRQGRTAEAKALYQRMLQENPAQPMAIAGLARINANKMADRLIATPAEGAAEGLFGVVAALSDARNIDVAMLYLHLSIYLQPGFDLARILLGDRYEDLNQYDKANEQYRLIAQGSPYHDMMQVQIALNDARQGDNAKGMASLRAFAAAHPDDSAAWTALGDLARSDDKYQEAADAYAKAIETLDQVNASSWNIFYARGIALSQADKWDEAEKDFRKALQISPDQAEVLNYLGYSWVDKGENLDEAVKMLEKARALRPFDGYIADSVGWAYYKLRRYREATTTLETAVQLAPGISEINDHLGDAYWQVGRKVEARFQWNHALSLSPDDKVKPVIEKKLQFGLGAASAGTGL